MQDIPNAGEESPPKASKSVFSISASDTLDPAEDDHQLDEPSIGSYRDNKFRFPKLDLRQLPYAPPAKGNDNPVKPIVQPAVNAGQQATDKAIQATANNSTPAIAPVTQVAQETADQIPPAAVDVNAHIPLSKNSNQTPTPPTTNQPNVSPHPTSLPPSNPQVANPSPATLPVANPPSVQRPATPPIGNTAHNVQSQPVDDEPGIVAPPAAEAAASARENALATQQAKAKQANPILPSSEGPAPPAPAPATVNNPAVSNAATSSPTTMSIQVPGKTSQKPLSEPSTPLPSSPESTAAATSYFPPSSRQTTTLPTSLQIPGPLPNAYSSLSNNSTSSTLSMTTASTPSISISLSSASSASQASATSASLMSVSNLLLSSTTAATSRSSQSSTPLTTSSPPSTFMTMTSSSHTSNQLSSAVSSSTSSLSSPSSTDIGGGIIGGTPTSSESPAATTSAAVDSGGGHGTPLAGVLAGSIVGGVAGIVLILLALLFLLRWRRGRIGQRRDISPPVPQMAGAGSAALGGAMTQRSSTRSTIPIAAAGLFGRLRPSSSQTATTTDTAPSERGFQKISGRKLASVLSSGGDGYGDAPPPSAGPSAAPAAKPIAPGHGPFAGLAPGLRPGSPQRSLSGSSFYRDSQGFYGGVVPADTSTYEATDPSSSPTSSSPTIPVLPSSGVPLAAAGRLPGTSSPGVANIRPGPARQPIIQQGGVVPMRTPSRAQPPRQRPTPPPIAEDPPDPLGRSHPSQDGSRQSRFRESTTPP